MNLHNKCKSSMFRHVLLSVMLSLPHVISALGRSQHGLVDDHWLRARFMRDLRPRHSSNVAALPHWSLKKPLLLLVYGGSN